MINETPTIHEADLHRAVPRQPVEQKHFTPSKTPWSVVGVAIISGLCIVLGVSGIVGPIMMLSHEGNSTLQLFGAPMVLGSLAIAVACFVVGIFGLACYNVAKAVMDMRDMMRHRGE